MVFVFNNNKTSSKRFGCSLNFSIIEQNRRETAQYLKKNQIYMAS